MEQIPQILIGGGITRP